uniref:Pancreatic trypsin inhibitor n=1 Tax=Rhipicephalus zambeziensis TaxID=60191 RepID=A0A224Y4V8_9ACAR
MIPKVAPAISILWLVGVCGAARPTQLKPYNAECTILFPVSETKNCRPVKYYYNSKTGLCGPTCSQDAPFSTRKECALTCRSTLACFIQRRQQRCRDRPRVVVFRFDVYKGKCYARKSCSYKGNNFPTLKECMSTCGAGAGSTKVSGGDEEGGSSSEQHVREQAPLPQLPSQTPGNLALPIRPELPSIGKPPSILQLPKEKPLLPGVPPTFPDQKPAPPIENGIQSQVPQVDPRCIVRISNTTRTCNASKLYFDKNTRLCKATCSSLAPFESRSECNSICRSAAVCFDKSQPELCKTNTKDIAFYFDALKGKCYARKGCSYRGNNFPTIEECKDTCSPYAGYRGPTNVTNASAVGPSDIKPSQPANKGEEDEKPPVSQPGTRVPPSTGPVLTHLVVRLTSVSDTAIKLLIAQKDPMCRISHLKFAATNCTHHYYYFHQISRLCKPTCSETAPFAARSACDKICRSAVVCFHQFEEEDCESRHKATVFFFDPKKGICLKKTGCSKRGNNFPTLQECILTCATYFNRHGVSRNHSG